MSTPFDEYYEQIIDPVNFIKNFPDAQGFRMWAENGGILDLHAAIDAFLDAELYEYCAIMQDVIDKRVDTMLGN